ncbi:GPI mannosyltransferase 3 [Taenia solium]|eukprot:TsM_000868600 transcript=TsM_000868600 gene=TsM_000868600
MLLSPWQHVGIPERRHKRSSKQGENCGGKTSTGGTILVLLGLIFLRLLNALMIRTTFVPDEVWQSVEVAHRWVYGFGALTWEWAPTVAIRSPLYPLFFAGIYKALAFSGVDSRDAIVLLPRLFHGLLTGVTDYTIYLMAIRLSGKSSAKWVLLAEMTSWFTAYCAPRSLSNSLEWALHAMAFRYYPWPPNLGLSPTSTTTVPFLFHVCLCILLRPTAAVLWVPVCLHYFLRIWKEYSFNDFRRTLCLALMIGLSYAAVSLGVDRLVFGRWTRWLIALLAAANIAVAGYTCLVHQRGPDALMSKLAKQAIAANWADMSPRPSILVLMPCHSTPYLSYLHVNVSLRLLSCDPDLSAWHNTDPRAYIDEADAFYKDPTRWLNSNYPNGDTLPQYIAMFTELTQNEDYGQAVMHWLLAGNYSICTEIFHSHIVSHPRHSRRITRRRSKFDL